MIYILWYLFIACVFFLGSVFFVMKTKEAGVTFGCVILLSAIWPLFTVALVCFCFQKVLNKEIYIENSKSSE